MTTQRLVFDSLLVVSQIGHAHGFFGNVYEEIVKVPDRIAAEERRHSPDTKANVFATGSPVRYYLILGPIAVLATVAAVPVGWPLLGIPRSLLVSAAALSLCAVALTAYIVVTVNRRLFFGTTPLPLDERQRLLQRWHRLNIVRLAFVAVTWSAVFATTWISWHNS